MASAIDNLRERWDRITPRERVMVIALGGTAAFLIVWFIATTISGGLDHIEQKNKLTRRALSALHEYRVQQALGVANDDRPKVPIGKDKVDLESYLEQVGKQVGVDIPGYSPRPDSITGKYAEVSTKIELRGIDIRQLKDMLQAIETGKQGRVVVTELHIKREFREQEKLDAELVVSTYYEKGEEGGDSKEEG